MNKNPSKAVVLINLGSPARPEKASVRRFLAQFLSDKRVIHTSRWIWWPILHFIILRIRPKRVAKLYQSIWTDQGSPLLVISEQQSRLLEEYIHQQGYEVTVRSAMTYGEPSIDGVMKELRMQGIDDFLMIPVFPQFSHTTTSAAKDAAGKVQLGMPGVKVSWVNDYHDHPAYIDALAYSVKQYWAINGRAEKLLMSFHGIPQDYVDKGDIYARQCEATANLLAEELRLDNDKWQLVFQSRFGPKQWLEPYADQEIKSLGHQGIESIQVISPCFSSDCLETLEEIADGFNGLFIESGGKKFEYIPALNIDDLHIKMLFCLSVDFIS